MRDRVAITFEDGSGVRQGRRSRVAATVAGALFILGILFGEFSKEDRLAVVAGSVALVVVAWSRPSVWPVARFLSTTVAGTCLAFAGIVGLETPTATSSWLVGAGLAGGARYWADSLMRAAASVEADQTRAQLARIAEAVDSGPPLPTPKHPSLLPATAIALVVGLTLGLSTRRRQPR